MFLVALGSMTSVYWNQSTQEMACMYLCDLDALCAVAAVVLSVSKRDWLPLTPVERLQLSHRGVKRYRKEWLALVQGQDFQGEPLLSRFAPAETVNFHWLQQELRQCCRPCVRRLLFAGSRGRSFACGVGVGIHSCLVPTYRCNGDCRRLEVNLNIICCETAAPF